MLEEVNAVNSFIFWSIVWTMIVNIPPGSTAIISAYRLNFLHGLISSLAAIACLYGVLGEKFTAMCTISYLAVDFVNIVANDHIWKVQSYQTPSARKMEYFHHFLCGGFGIFCELYYKTVCTSATNPFIPFMLAEISTPFLIAWRHTQLDILGIIFAVLFFAVRLVYHVGFYIPACMEQCDRTVSLMFGVLYTLMNIFFTYNIVKKLLKGLKGSNNTKGKELKD